VKLQIEYSLDLLGAFGEGRFQVSILKILSLKYMQWILVWLLLKIRN